MHNGPTNTWSKSNKPSLRQNQGDSVLVSSSGWSGRLIHEASGILGGSGGLRALPEILRALPEMECR